MAIKRLILEKDPETGLVVYQSSPGLEFNEAFGMIEETMLLLKEDYKLARRYIMQQIKANKDKDKSEENESEKNESEEK